MTLSEVVIREDVVLTRLYDGWDEVERVTIAPDLCGLVLRHRETGQSVCWYVDDDGQFLANHAAFLDGTAREALLTALDPWARLLTNNSLASSPKPLTPEMSDDLATLPRTLLAQVAGVWTVNRLRDITVHPATWARTGGTLSGASGLAIEEARVSALLDSRITGDALVVTSPFTGAPLRAQIVLDCDELAIYRFHDPDMQAAFYLAWRVHVPGERPAFFCPRAQLVVSDQPDPALLPGRLIAWYATHPDHVAQIEAAIPFQAQDFGLGHASALGEIRDAAPSAPGGDAATDTSRSAAWHLLRSQDVVQTPTAARARNQDRPRLWRRLFGKARPGD